MLTIEVFKASRTEKILDNSINKGRRIQRPPQTCICRRAIYLQDPGKYFGSMVSALQAKVATCLPKSLVVVIAVPFAN